MSVAKSLYDPINTFLPAGTVEGYFSRFCVQNRDDKFYVRDTTTGYWHLYSASAATKMLYQQHKGLHQGLAISRDGVETYVKREAYVVDGTVFIPNGPPGAVFDGRRCLNTYNDRASLVANRDILLSNTETRKYLILFCRLIRESLCAKAGEKSHDEMLAILAGGDAAELEFRFVMHWLAAVQQSPGVNLQTNLWFLGQLGGVGKGTLARVLKMMHPGMVGTAVQAEIEGGWTDHFAGHLLMVVDEFRDSKHFLWGPFIKRETTNPIIALRKRNEGTISVLNTMNWLFFSNNVNPMRIEQYDRRNFQVATTNDPIWMKYALDLNNWLDANPGLAKDLAAGFAHVLNGIAVDKDLIATATDTPLRAENRQYAKNAVECWAVDDDLYARDKWVLTRELFDRYQNWRRVLAEDSAIRSSQAFSRYLGQFARESGGIESRLAAANKTEWLISSAKFPAGSTKGPAANPVDIRERLRQMGEQSTQAA